MKRIVIIYFNVPLGFSNGITFHICINIPMNDGTDTNREVSDSTRYRNTVRNSGLKGLKEAVCHPHDSATHR